MVELNKALGSGAMPLLKDVIGSPIHELQNIIVPLRVGQKSPALPFEE